MDGTAADQRLFARPPRLVTWLVCAFILAGATAARSEEIFRDPAEGANVSWGIELREADADLVRHRRQNRLFHDGKDAEELVVRSRNVGGRIAIFRATPPAQALEDLKASLWVRYRIKGSTLGLGITFPHQIDPETGRPLFALIQGAPAEGSDRFQELTVTVTRDEISRVQTLHRGRLGRRVDTRTIDFRDPYVDQVVLLVPTGIGESDVHWDDLAIGPIVAPTDVEQAAASAPPRTARLSWADNRLLSDGQPVTPRFVTYQGEPATILRELCFNAAWIEDATEQSVMQALSGEGIGIFATPPAPPDAAGREKVSMPPFGPESAAVDCWMLGRLDMRKLDEVQHWSEMVQDADRQRRLLLGDVAGHVREFHRCVPLLGASRHIIHTSHSPADYAEFLETRRRQALAGRPMTTLLPTETAEAIRTTRRSTDIEPVFEPEQIALCTHLAAASGYKLFGFWTHTPLDSDAPGMEERRQILKLLNLEFRLLEPWLSSGSIIRPTDVRVGEAPARQKSKSRVSFNPFASGWSTPADEAGPKSPYQAVILRASPGLLVLVDSLQDGAQFQPGPMTEQSLRFITMRYDDVPTAFEVTTTSIKMIELDQQPVGGGLEVVLKDFDQHAAIVMTSDLSKIEELRREVSVIAKEAATASVALATAKLTRVEKVHQELQPLSPPVADAAQTLHTARQYLRAADDDLVGGRYDEARRKSQKAMAWTRHVQKSYWDLAVKRLSSPVASPHAICFQTLPDHWRMLRRLNSDRSAGENLLRSGDFEDQDAVQTQWTLRADPSGRGGVALNTRSAQGRFSLALTAQPATDRPAPVDDPLVTLYSPPVAVRTGQLVRVTGRVLLPQDLQGSTDGLVVYDTLKGSVGAHRFRKASPPGKWQSFEMYRDVLSSGEFKLVFELRGWGEAWIDDLAVSAIEPQEPAVQTAGGTR
ncbi:hypothetical protein Pan44_26280 [Caulifigura coniformis]|uniref:Uncharacterized protein n=1 Tax=Caulifigura coniformis TaxID=2527983 RepID=A0A517SEP2_9PLAN|nr:hypothetical protein [Caulifigura coniformis]QDT54595.1 hypothetical protein Pan44_26280 [Caulifigura coniformis]